MLPVSVLSAAQLAARNPEPLQRLGGLAGSREFRCHGHTLQGMELINFMDYRWEYNMSFSHSANYLCSDRNQLQRSLKTKTGLLLLRM